MIKSKSNKFWTMLYVVIFLLGWLFSQFILTPLLHAEDTKEILTLKRDLAQERVARIQTQLSLMQQQFKDGQEYLKEVTKTLDDLNAQLKELELKKEGSRTEKPKAEEKKK